MAELNIPMRTKASMDLGMVFAQGGEERILPAMDLQNVQNGMGQRPSGRTQSSSPTRSVRQNPPVQAANSRREALRREVRHYEVRSEGGIVLNKGGKVSFSSLYPGRLGPVSYTHLTLPTIYSV